MSSLPAVRDVRRIGRRLEIRLAEDGDASELLERVASRARVRHFDVRAASLHSIFVKLVSPAATATNAEPSPEPVPDPEADPSTAQPGLHS